MLTFLKKLDRPMCLALLLMAFLSLSTLASFSYGDDPQFAHFYKQGLWFLLGIGIFLSAAFFDYRIFLNYSWSVLGVYITSLFLLVATFFSPEIRNSQAWIVLGPVQFQPVEFAKFALLLFWAKYFSWRHIEIARVRHIVVSLFYLLPPALIVASQPDLGSASILFGLWLVMVLISGIKLRHFVVVILVFTIMAIGLWGSVLKEYQKDRIISFIYPNEDPLGASYNVNQSKIAIGSGGIFGKGPGKGTQVQYGFLPEAKTDFIFAGYIEEWGLVGAALFFLLFGYFIYRILRISYLADNNFAKLFSMGAAGLFIIQTLLNIGSNMGILPATGVTLPFFSYGGSSIIISFLIAGMVQSIYIRLGKKYRVKFKAEWN